MAPFFVAAIALGLYLATMQPDFGGPEDTPKFQFLGYVLGTAHQPGYPLYVPLSHLEQGKISNQIFEEWNRETAGRKRPERVRKKAKTARTRKRKS